MNTEKKNKIDVDEIIIKIEFWLNNGIEPHELEEYEKNFMMTWKGKNWMDKWVNNKDAQNNQC